MRALGERIGLSRVAAILIGCALALEVVRAQLLPRGSWGGVVATFGEIAFLALGAGVFVAGRQGKLR